MSNPFRPASRSAVKAPLWLAFAILVSVCSSALGISQSASAASSSCGVPAGLNAGIDTEKYPPPRPCLQSLRLPPVPDHTPEYPPTLMPHEKVAPTASVGTGKVPSLSADHPSTASVASHEIDPGISDNNLADICPTSGCPISFSYFKTGLGVTRARIIVPYDTIATYDPSAGCVMDYSQNIDPDTQQPYDVALYYWLEAAKRNGLAPMIALDQGTGRDPDSGQADPGLPKATQAEPWAVYDYYCGMYWLMNVVNPSGTGWKASDGSPLIATQWEVFNEPDRYDGAFTATDDGNAWIWADLASEAYSGETVGALTMSSMCDSCVPANQSKTAYVQNFISYLRSNGDPLPGTYSLHDYMDVDTDAYYQTADPAAARRTTSTTSNRPCRASGSTANQFGSPRPASVSTIRIIPSGSIWTATDSSRLGGPRRSRCS